MACGAQGRERKRPITGRHPTLLATLPRLPTHFSWKCYKKEGAEAAGKSNLSLGTHGPDAVDSQMRERKGSNYDVAHRRWLLYPNTPRMGVGGTDYFNEAFNYYGATAVWIIDDSTFSGPRPATRNKYVAWPPPGYVPYQVVWARWSFSYPGADFSAAKVTLRRGTTLLGVKREAPSGGSADNTLVWVANTQNSLYNEDRFEPWDKPTAVQKINVTITGGLLLRGAGGGHAFLQPPPVHQAGLVFLFLLRFQ